MARRSGQRALFIAVRAQDYYCAKRQSDAVVSHGAKGAQSATGRTLARCCEPEDNNDIASPPHHNLCNLQAMGHHAS